MVQTTISAGFQASGEATIKAALPAWVDRACVTVVRYESDRPQWKVGFRCDCRKAKWYVPVKIGERTISQVAKSAHDLIAAAHGAHNGPTTAAAPPTKREALLEAEVISSAERQRVLQRQVNAAKADSGAAAELATNERKVKQEETRHATRVKEINYDDDSTLGTSAKHTALNGSKNGSENSHTGLLECVKY